ncbi:hypothetical protein BS47DRAFT_9980 [Hydnum rufescens UP504]|uniref:Uncharacterized protein n=1 Tax=Hydnum rufescens UP504 TaxID=1448309 RepID=A0A9P6BB43_9AGAM|nr:hypothetical protein BS47DRAFT_9980 [Hydnum rufescens UP504]
MTLRDGDATCVQLPSPIRGLPLRTWTLHGIDNRFFEIAFDPHSDLLVVMGAETDEPTNIVQTVLHLRTLSSNEPHPRATNATIPFSSYFSRIWRVRHRCPIHIMQHLVGFVFDFDGTARLAVWDWTAGCRVVSLELGRDYFTGTFAFISPTSFAVPRPLELEVYQFSTDGPEMPPILKKPSYILPRFIVILYLSTLGAATSSSDFIDRSPLAIPSEVWACGVSFHDDLPMTPFLGLDNAHDGRIVRLIAPSPNSGLPLSLVLLDLNQNRGRRRSRMAGNPQVPLPALTDVITYAEDSSKLLDASECIVTSRIVDSDVGNMRLLCTGENIIIEKSFILGHPQPSDIELVIKTVGAAPN